jgi:hypothetical protein
MQDDTKGKNGGEKPPPERRRVEKLGDGDPLAPNGRIGAQLRAFYDEIEREPIPTDLIELLERLDEAEKRKPK